MIEVGRIEKVRSTVLGHYLKIILIHYIRITTQKHTKTVNKLGKTYFKYGICSVTQFIGLR